MDGVDLYWLPLGAGGRCVRFNGCAYERLVAWHERRPPSALYHAALEVRCDDVRWVIEMAPVWNERAPERGVVQEGAVGAAALGGFQLFRYEVRRWRDGRIPDVDEAVDSPYRVSMDALQAAAVLAAVPFVPPLVWGRDQLRCGDMWNSNSLVAWLLAVTAHDMLRIRPPAGGRAPGWRAGLVLAGQQEPSRTAIS